jgi:glutamate synthase (NADPH/NADH) small chain
MDPQPASVRNPKYTWRDVVRTEAPKRSVGDRIADFRAVYRPYDEATASEQASRCIQCPNPSCVSACPLAMPIPDLLRLTADRQFTEAAKLLFENQSMPELFVHVCAGERMCEAACMLSDKAEPVSISSISRFILDYGWKNGLFEPPASEPKGQRVAVVGSGLCGLVAADELSRAGYEVTVFDAYRKPGGRLVNGLPGFRVDRELIERRVRLLERRGVQFRTGMVCGRDLKLGELRRDFDAVFFGLGRANPVKLEIPGARLHGVRQAYPFVLRNTSDITLKTPPVSVQGRRVVVLGGGETAVDALRVAIRCGASGAVCVYRRNIRELSASPREIANAEEEGARFITFAQAVEIVGNEQGYATHVRCVRTAPGAPDSTGRSTVSPVAGSEFDVPADVVFVAYGYEPPKLTQVDEFSELAFNDKGFLIVDNDLMTNLPGVFAGGSVVRGSIPLVTIVHDSCQAAKSIDRYLSARRAMPVGLKASG